MARILTFPHAPPSPYSIRIPAKLARSRTCSYFLYFKDSRKLYGPCRLSPLKGRACRVTGTNRRGLHVPGGHWLKQALRTGRLDPAQEKLLRTELERVNRTVQTPDIITLEREKHGLSVTVTNFSSRFYSQKSGFPADWERIKRTVKTLTGILQRGLAGRDGRQNPGDIDELRSAGYSLFRQVFKPRFFREYFSGRSGLPCLFILPPELFHLPVEFMYLDRFFCLDFPLARSVRIAPEGPVRLSRNGFCFMEPEDLAKKKFALGERKILASLFEKKHADFRYLAFSPDVFGTVYREARHVHITAHGDLRRGSYGWRGAAKTRFFEPLQDHVPEFIFSSACNPGFFSREFCLFLQKLMTGNCRVWIGGTADLPRNGSPFVSACYRRLLNGKSAGEAVFSARTELFEEENREWMAYGLVGDIFYRLFWKK